MQLSKHPFFVLDGSPQYSGLKLSALASKKSIFIKDGTPQQAVDALMEPPTRLRAEIRWFPGCAPETAKALVRFASAADERIPAGAASLPPLAVFNALLYALPLRQSEGMGLAKALNDLGKYQLRLMAQEILDLINNDRKLARYPLLSGPEDVDTELAALITDAKALAVSVYKSLDPRERGALAAQLDSTSLLTKAEITGTQLTELAAEDIRARPDPGKRLKALEGAVAKLKSAQVSAPVAAAPPPPAVKAQAETQPQAASDTDAEGGTVYAVSAAAPPVIPAFCTCCMAPVQKEDVEEDEPDGIFGTQEPSPTGKFPLCPACRSHSSRFPSNIIMLCTLPIFAAMLLAAMLGGTGGSVAVPFVLFILFARVAHLFQLNQTVKSVPFGDGHTGSWESVRILHDGANGEKTVYGFSSKAYAALFAQKNGAEITEVPSPQDSKASELIKSSPSFGKLFRLWRGVALAFSFVLLLLISV